MTRSYLVARTMTRGRLGPTAVEVLAIPPNPDALAELIRVRIAGGAMVRIWDPVAHAPVRVWGVESRADGPRIRLSTPPRGTGRGLAPHEASRTLAASEVADWGS